METKASYLLVGIVVILSITATFMFFIWLAGGPNKSQYTQVMIYFPGSVSGLSVGSPVRYRGVDVGKVKTIELDPQMPDQVHVLVDVLKATPLQQDMRANLQMMGITGLSFIELTGDGTHKAPLMHQENEPYLIIYGSESALEKVMNDIPKLMDSYSDVAYSILETLNAENRKELSETLKEINAFSKTLQQTQQDFDVFMDDTQKILNRFDEYSQTGIIDLHYFLRDARKAANEISDLSQSLRNDPSSIIYQPTYEGHKLE
ncbi:MAG TPA: MlaD family protein [Gammaproteobacteria bacterium]|nr:MlaD family protein [Gammaproteobacteria bacterium]